MHEAVRGIKSGGRLDAGRGAAPVIRAPQAKALGIHMKARAAVEAEAEARRAPALPVERAQAAEQLGLADAGRGHEVQAPDTASTAPMRGRISSRMKRSVGTMRGQ